MRLADKVAVVTGAARGIGAACARRFAAEGADVVLGDILEEKGEATAQAIRDNGGRAVFMPCDTGDGPQARALIEQTVSRHGRIDVLVNKRRHLHDCGLPRRDGGGTSTACSAST